ncbi:hypothetical protein HHK36_020651 [Tetracentron sinense]|uniref:Xylanase inhibitor C-terminal domain-containing protein n=1 Tax=Tetracentron sinense TaxID=13715 RepID=A0A835D874_TETSI|nr:hypothetical protein HHK36_020651 [Tetracentron sinense]
MNITRVAAVAPFGVCFSSKNIVSTRVGLAVPSIDLVLQSESVFWRIFGANSMVQVSDNVICIGFVDGGLNDKDFDCYWRVSIGEQSSAIRSGEFQTGVQLLTAVQANYLFQFPFHIQCLGLVWFGLLLITEINKHYAMV